MENMTQFIDAETYGGIQKEGMTYQQIVLYQVSRITKKASTEWKGGYYNYVPHPNPNRNSAMQIYVPDSRKEFINAVQCLADMLFPYYDKQAEKEVKEFFENVDEDLEKLKNKLKDENDTFNKFDYWDERAEYYRKLLKPLLTLLRRMNFLESQTFED